MWKWANYECRIIALGLLDKADVQNQPTKTLLIKNTLCMALPSFGLLTHDYGSLDQPINANMVFTVEPDLCPKRGLAFGWKTRWWYNKQANPKLDENIPIEAEEIEALMNP